MLYSIIAVATVSMFQNQEQQLTEVWRLAEAPTVSIGGAQAGYSESLGKVVSATRLSTGVLVIGDEFANHVRFYGPDSDLLREVGRLGEGPGEFAIIRSVRRCAADSVFVYDPLNVRVTVMTPDGQVARTFAVRSSEGPGVPADDFWCNRNGVLGYLHKSLDPPTGVGPMRSLVPVQIVRPGHNGVVAGRFPGSERYFTQYSELVLRLLGKRTTMAMAGEWAVVATGDFLGTSDRFELQRIDTLGVLVPPLVGTAPRQRVSSKHVYAAIEKAISELRELLRGGSVNENLMRATLRNRENPEMLPAYRTVLVDVLDNVWVEPYVAPGENTEPWVVYGQGGNVVARVEMPGGREILDVGSDYVVVLTVDRMGADIVEVYALEKDASQRVNGRRSFLSRLLFWRDE